MHAALTAVADYFRRLADGSARGWREFWFRPSDPIVLGMIRLLTGLMLLYDLGIYTLDLHPFLSPSGWFGPDGVRFQHEPTLFAIPALQSSPGLEIAHALALVTVLLFTVGLWTRLTALLTAVWLLSYIHRAPWVLFGFDQILIALVLYLTVAPSGLALSLDHLVRRRAREPAARQPAAVDAHWGVTVGIRLIQLHICLVYLCSGLGKLQSPNWWNGQALWYVAANYEFQDWASMTWIASSPYLLNFLTHLVVLWELTFPVLIWVPLLRPLMLAAAVLLHVGIGIFMGMPTFGATMLIADAAFVDAGWLRRVLDRLFGAGAGE